MPEGGAWSVGLVFVGTDGPDRLQGELVRVHAGVAPVAPFRPEEHPLTLPPRDRRNELALDVERARGGLDVVGAQRRDPAAAQLVRSAEVAAHPPLSGSARGL